MACERRLTGATRYSIFAFTLIELLVVVAIIAVLISILLPSLSSAREQARNVQCLSNLKSISGGVSLYANEYRGMLPGPLHPPVYRSTAVTDNPDFPPMNPDTERPWFLLSRLSRQFTSDDEQMRYIDRIATCPTAKMKNPDQNFIRNQNGNPSWSRPYNYLINSFVNTNPKQYFGWVNIGVTWAGWAAQYAQNADNMSYQPPKMLDSIRGAANEWAVGDAWWSFKRVMILPGQFRDSMLGTWQVTTSNSANSSCNPLPKAPYHKTGKVTNLVYFDGHAAGFTGIDDWAQRFPGNRDPATWPQ
jgi:prepilin-type N-terminal cleavage/methylation domain-containing protein/prepilin-type processing-associated H-X9-DG protein